MADGLPSDTLVSCAFDREGALWLGTARGLARFLPATGACVTLGRPHGLPGESCQQGVLRLDEQDRLWVGTTEGAAIIAPGTVPPVIPPCAVFLTGARIMGRTAEMADGLEIEDSDYDLVIDDGAVTFVAAAQVVYRTQLVGLEDAWSPPQRHRFARYTNLRPGDYTFRVAARNWGGSGVSRLSGASVWSAIATPPSSRTPSSAPRRRRRPFISATRSSAPWRTICGPR